MLYVLSVGRDLENSFPTYKRFVQELLFTFSDTKFYLYENNSEDATKILLNEFAEECKSFIHFSEDFSMEKLRSFSYALRADFKPNRMECIARARNKILDIVEPLLKDDDLVIWIDPDMRDIPYMPTLIHWVRNFPKGVDALFANGQSVNGKYYDAMAYSDPIYPLGIELVDQEPWLYEKYKYIQQTIPFDAPFRRVFSAFGGLAIYRASSIRGCRYKGEPTREYHEYAKWICKTFPENPMVKSLLSAKHPVHIKGCVMGNYLFGKNDWFYRNCYEYNFPVMCEHIIFHVSMILKGHDKLFICPSLIYFSDHFA